MVLFGRLVRFLRVGFSASPVEVALLFVRDFRLLDDGSVCFYVLDDASKFLSILADLVAIDINS